jgi:O-antigen/teichoic acid export membrane protein
MARRQCCVNEGLTRLHLASTAAGVLLNFTLKLALSPRYSAVGAAQATTAWTNSFCFTVTRECAGMQTCALFIAVRWFRYAFSR